MSKSRRRQYFADPPAAPPALCGFCGHYMGEFNKHGFDQNDGDMDEAGRFRHTGRCTYCYACNPRLRGGRRDD